MRYQCFMLEPTERAEHSLRRFVFSREQTCTGHFGYHNASVDIGTVDYPMSECDGDSPHTVPRDDPRWPTKCECGYVFVATDAWQENRTRLYKRADGEPGLWTLRHPPIGAMWDATWYPWKGPDGRCLVVQLPPDKRDEHWCIDDHRQIWTRTGEPPNITVTPSILTPRYHGWLRNGWLEPA